MTGPSPAAARKRLDAFEAVFQVAQLTVKRSMKGWRPFVALAVVLLPAALSAIVRLSSADQEDQEAFFYGVLSRYQFGIAVPFVSLVFATAFPWPESDEGTLTYWFTSPIPRWTVLLGRYLAALLVGAVTLGVGAVCAGIALDMPRSADAPGVTRAALTATLLAYPAYLALFQVVAAVFRHGLVFGVVFIIVENVASLLTGTMVVRLTLIFYVRSLVWPAIAAGSRERAEPLLLVEDPASTAASLAAFGSVTAVALLVSLLAVSVIEYRGRTSQQG